MPAIVIPAPISSNHAAPVTAGGTGATTAAAARTNLDVYSKSEVTNAISQSTAIVYGVGTNIPSNSNFNDYTSPGAYSVASQAIAESITNIPYKQAGRLEVRGTLSTYIIQYYYPYANVNRFYMRRYTNAWSDWYEYDDVAQTTALGGKRVQWGHLSVPSIAASGQTEITVTLPVNYNGGNDYMAVVTPIVYAAASYINYVIRNKSSGSFVVRIYNSSTSVINDTYLDWITIGV